MSSPTAEQSAQLQRSTSFFGAIVLGLGSIIGTGAFVSIGLAAELAHGQLLVALLIAALVATCNGLSSAQLAAIHPVSGGTYEYGYTFLNPLFGFSAGWLFVLAKSASAAAAAVAVAHVTASWLGWDQEFVRWIALDVLLLMTIFVLLGLKRSNQLNTVLVIIAIAGLLLFSQFALTAPAALKVTADLQLGQVAWSDTLAAAALLFVAYTGYGRIATMGEEVQQPRRTIPRAIIVTVIVVTLLYGLVAWALLQFPDILPGTANLAERARMFGAEDWLVTSLMIAATLAMVGVILNLILGVSRVVLAMARRGDLPTGWAKLNSDRTSAPRSVWATFIVMIGFAAASDIALAWQVSAFTVLVYYGITNLAALRIPEAKRFVPQWVSMMGLAGCLGLAVFIDPVILATGGGLLLVGLMWHLFRQRA